MGISPLFRWPNSVNHFTSDKTQHAIGTGVFGGMISGTVLAIFFVPVFFIVISRFTEVIAGKRKNKNDGYI